MKAKLGILMCGALLGATIASNARAGDAGAVMAGAVSNYVAGVMQGLRAVADRQPTAATSSPWVLT